MGFDNARTSQDQKGSKYFFFVNWSLDPSLIEIFTKLVVVSVSTILLISLFNVSTVNVVRYEDLRRLKYVVVVSVTQHIFCYRQRVVNSDYN